jgi:hypothetical protein
MNVIGHAALQTKTVRSPESKHVRRHDSDTVSYSVGLLHGMSLENGSAITFQHSHPIHRIKLRAEAGVGPGSCRILLDENTFNEDPTNFRMGISWY